MVAYIKFSPYLKENTKRLETTISKLVRVRKMMAVYFENLTKTINALCGQNI
jgi:hypothetical protein